MSTKRRLFEDNDDIQTKVMNVLKAYPGSTSSFIQTKTGLRSCAVYRTLRSFVKFDMAYAVISERNIKTEFNGRASHRWYPKED